MSLVLSSGVVGGASGWNDCVVSPEDEWKPARERSPAMRMRYVYERRYTCDNVKGAYVGGRAGGRAGELRSTFFHTRNSREAWPPCWMSR